MSLGLSHYRRMGHIARTHPSLVERARRTGAMAVPLSVWCAVPGLLTAAALFIAGEAASHD